MGVGTIGAPSTAQAGVPITLYESLAGNIDFVGAAGSLRVGNCGVAASGSGTVTGIPAGATIEAAYLYWAGSGTTPDNTITFATPASAGTTVTADRTFLDDFNSGGTTYDFFSGFADVTSLVAAGGNGMYTMSNLTFATGTPWSNISVCLGGWSLIVVYEDTSEPLRVINVFDGFEDFRGSEITLVPDNFVVPTSPINGKLGHITWEGDVGNSGTLGGFSESLTFEGSVLSDTNNPPGTQFNSVSSVSTPATSPPGVDFDVYDLAAPELFAGQTSGTNVYASGSDRVILSVEIFSVTNTPVSDLSIVKADTGDFIAGTNGGWTLSVSNAGPSDEPGPIVISDTLPADVTFVSASGTGWSCSEAAGVVTCSNASAAVAGTTLAPVTLEVAVDAGATGSISNTADVSGANFDNISGNDTSTDTTPIVVPDVSTSTKSVLDLNGGEVEPGDVLQYTISVSEAAGVALTDVAVTDDIPVGVNSFNVVGLPAGVTDASTFGTTGANGTGFLDIQDIAVPASGSADVVFEVTVDAGLSAGSTISNTGVVTPPSGSPEDVDAPDLTVLASQVPGSGTKELYLGDTASSGRDLSRTAPNGLPPTASLGNVGIVRTDSETWALAEALAAPLSLSGDDVPVVLWIRKGGASGGAAARSIDVTLASSSLGTIASGSLSLAAPASPAEFTIALSPTASLPATLPTGDVLTLEIENTTGGSGNRRIRIFPTVTGASGGNSRVELNALTVINVDSVDAYDAPAPGGATVTSFAPGDSLSLRSVVSDPFGAFDISGANIEVFDPSGTSVLGPVAMPEVASLETASTKTFETPFTLSGTAALGTWSVEVTASEGAEGTITDLGVGTFVVSVDPDVVIFKTVVVLNDPVNGSTNAKAIPGANVIYTIGVSNQGAGPATPISIEDVLPVELELYVDDYVTPGPIHFLNGSPTSGLSTSFVSLADDGDSFEFDDGTDTWILDPVADGEGFDESVRALRVNPSGSLSGSSGTPPSFQIRFRARIR